MYRDWGSNTDMKDFIHRHRDCVVTKVDGGILIDSTRYTETHPQGTVGDLDRIKVKSIYKEGFTTGDGEIVFEMTVNPTQHFDVSTPIPLKFLSRIRNIHDDYRLCCFGMGIESKDGSTSYMVLVTNTSIYGLYERDEGGHRHTSTFLLSSKRHTSVITVSIGIDGDREVVKWYVGGKECFSVSLSVVGVRLGDQYSVLAHTTSGNTTNVGGSDTYHVFHGHFSFLDHQIPNNYSREKVFQDRSTQLISSIPRSKSGLVMLLDHSRYLEIYPDTYGTHHNCLDGDESTFSVSNDSVKHRIFGQGMTTYIISSKVSRRLHPSTRQSSLPKLRQRSDIPHYIPLVTNDNQTTRSTTYPQPRDVFPPTDTGTFIPSPTISGVRRNMDSLTSGKVISYKDYVVR